MDYEEKEMLQIRMFGGFCIKWKEREIVSSVRTKKLWMLIEFLILYREQPVSQEELFLALWNQEECDNPSSALKNLIYRARNYLQKELGIDAELILFKDGGYRWTPDLPCWIDCEEMQRCFENSISGSLEDRIAMLRRAVLLYQGTFLPRMGYVSWVQQERVKYEKMYETCAIRLSELLLENEKYEELIRIMEYAASQHPESEELCAALLRGYLKAGYYHKALEYYNSIANSRKTTALHHLYEQLIRNINAVDFDLSTIKEELREAESEVGAFLCEYSVFKNIYRMQARSLMRDNRYLLIGLVALSGEDGREIQPALQNQITEAVKETLVVGLRRGDAVSQYGKNQFVLLLSHMEESDGQNVAERLEKSYEKNYPDLPVTWNVRFSRIEPME